MVGHCLTSAVNSCIAALHEESPLYDYAVRCIRSWRAAAKNANGEKRPEIATQERESGEVGERVVWAEFDIILWDGWKAERLLGKLPEFATCKQDLSGVCCGK